MIGGLDEARAALASARRDGVGVRLVTPEGASAYMGAAWFKAIAEALTPFPPELERLVYHCGARPGDVLAALRHGIQDIAVDASLLTPALTGLARAMGARLSAGDGSVR